MNSISDSDEDGSTYCEPRHVFISVTNLSPNPVVRWLLDDALGYVQSEIDKGNLGPIPNQGWRRLGRNAVSMAVFNEVHEYTTWPILSEALEALEGWMSDGERWGTCYFDIWNGPTRVGQGNINGVT